MFTYPMTAGLLTTVFALVLPNSPPPPPPPLFALLFPNSPPLLFYSTPLLSLFNKDYGFSSLFSYI